MEKIIQNDELSQRLAVDLVRAYKIIGFLYSSVKMSPLIKNGVISAASSICRISKDEAKNFLDQTTKLS